MALEANLNVALSGQYVRAFTAVQISLPAVGANPAYNINLIDGSGSVTFPIDGVNTTFTGKDSNFGALDNLGSIAESVATEAPSITLTLLSPTIGQISDPRYQGAPVRIWIGAVDDSTGNVIGTPERRYKGWLDTAVTTHGMNSQKTTLNVASVWDRLFIGSEGFRLNAEWHRKLFPGEGGLDNAVEASGQIPWGVEGAVASSVNYNASVRAILNKLAPNAISKD